MPKITFEQTVKRVAKINDNLRENGFKEKEIHDFWFYIINLIPEIANAHKIGKPIKICKGCGTLNIQISKYVSQTTCCPEANYINVEA